MSYNGHEFNPIDFSVKLHYKLTPLLTKQQDVVRDIYVELSDNSEYFLKKMGLHPEHTDSEIDEQLESREQKKVFDFAKELGAAEVFCRYRGDLEFKQDMSYAVFDDSINLKAMTEIDLDRLVSDALNRTHDKEDKAYEKEEEAELER